MTINLKSLLQKAKQERTTSITEKKADNERCNGIFKVVDESEKSIPAVINDIGFSSGIRGISISSKFSIPTDPESIGRRFHHTSISFGNI